ncbi:MAG: hypothetical protein M1826_006974 [Phylliscum demangeonii]|nr:MAG: hypothetical protein M1826_006974 [Phylliscum demangeonii]
MLPRATDDAGATKCYFSSGPLPAFINAEQPPLKKKPLAALASNPFNQLVELILSREAYGAIEGELSRKLRPIRYGTVNLPPSALLEREFLSTHIKTGNLIMLSEGRLGVDDTYTLCDGILRLYLDRASYERSGLVGTPHGSAKAKRAKSRWVVEIKLRLPSMVHGKNGFKRIERAFAQVLTTSLSWRFCDPDDVDRYHPIYRTAEPAVSATAPVHVPLGNTGTVPFLPLASDPSAADHPPTATRDAIEEWAIATHEWLSLISLGSPRVHAHDSIDPYLSRYAVPLPSPTTDDDGDRRPPPPQTLTRVQWRGLFPASWIVHLCIQTLFVGFPFLELGECRADGRRDAGLWLAR